jgi:hypothetical protein
MSVVGQVDWEWPESRVLVMLLFRGDDYFETSAIEHNESLQMAESTKRYYGISYELGRPSGQVDTR